MNSILLIIMTAHLSVILNNENAHLNFQASIKKLLNWKKFFIHLHLQNLPTDKNFAVGLNI